MKSWTLYFNALDASPCFVIVLFTSCYISDQIICFFHVDHIVIIWNGFEGMHTLFDMKDIGIYDIF